MSVGGDSPEKQQVEPRFRELPFDANDEVLSDVYTSLTGDSKMERLGNPATSLVFLREANSDKTSVFPQDALMDALLEKANTIAKEVESKKGKKKAAERGFQGTLLSSVRSAPAGSAKEERASDVSEKENEIAEGDLKTKGEKDCLEATGTTTGTGTIDNAEIEANTRDGRVSERGSRSSSAAESVLEQVGYSGGSAAILERLKDMFEANLDQKKAEQVTKWALDQKSFSTRDELIAAAVDKYLSI